MNHCPLLLIAAIFIIGCGSFHVNADDLTARTAIRDYDTYGGAGKTVVVSAPRGVLSMFPGRTMRFFGGNGAVNPPQSTIADLSKDKLQIADFTYDETSHTVIMFAEPLYRRTSERFSWEPTQICTVQLEGSHVTTIKEGVGRVFGSDFNPITKHIVYSAMQNETSPAGDLYWFDYGNVRDVPSITQITDSPDHEAYPEFLPYEDCLLYFRASRFGSNSPIATPRWHQWVPVVASLHDGNAKNRALIVESIESLYYPKVSPNGLWLFYASNTKEISNLHLLALPDGKPYTLVESLRKVFPREGDGLFEHAYNILCPSFSADSKSLILGIQAKPMRSHGESFLLGPFVITRLDMSSGVVSTLGEVSRNTSSFSYSPDGDIFYVYEEFKGFSEVRLNESSH